MELNKYSTEDLREELRRRRYKKNGDWYYIYEDEGETDPEWKSEIPQFTIINRRIYHLKHRVDTTSISHFLKLPPHFREKHASHFIYEGKWNVGKKEDYGEEAKKLLNKHGFQELKNPVLDNDALLIDSRAFADKGPMEIRWHLDREFRDQLSHFILHHTFGTRFTQYMEDMRSFASSCGHVAYFYNNQGDLCQAAFLPVEVFASLPKNPYNRREGEE